MSGAVSLRDVDPADLPVLYQQQLDPESLRMAAFKSRDWAAFQAHWSKIVPDAANTTRVVIVDGEVAGYVACWPSGGEREVGYWIGRAYWGRGVATRALAALLALVPERPLAAYVARHNAASIRVLEKCGFARAGEDGDHLILRLPTGGQEPASR